MIKLLILFILALIVFASYDPDGYRRNSNSLPRIINGIPIAEANFVVSIRVFGTYKCVGSLVSPRHVVTAAHCVAGRWPITLTVMGGSTLLSEQRIKRYVRKVFIPKDYNRPALNKDLAVLVLTPNMRGENISTIQLCNSKSFPQLNVYGWGRTRFKDSSNRLRMVQVPFVEQKQCRQAFKYFMRITPSMFCAGDLRYRDACYGDSGGPAIYDNRLCGVVSWGRECASNIYPGVYTNINAVKGFIENVVENY